MSCCERFVGFGWRKAMIDGAGGHRGRGSALWSWC
jgi:hypothetical protein